MKKRMSIMLISMGILLGLIFGWWGLRQYFMAQYFANMPQPAVTISATVAAVQTWQPYLTAIGTLNAVEGVDVSTQVAGIVTTIKFNSGQMVNKNDLLIQLDTSVEEADVKNYTSQVNLAQIDYQRQAELLKNRSVSKSAVDTSYSQLQQAQAGLERTKAIIDQKNIEAPFSGKLGIRQVNVGQYVAAGTTLVTLQALDTLHVDINLPEQDLPQLFLEQEVEVSSPTPNSKIYKGTITAFNSKVDQTTRSIQIQATIANPNNLLLPGMSTNVKILLPQQKQVITLPQTAIAYSLYGDSVFIIHEEGKDKDGKPILKVKRAFVKVGERRGDIVAILEGVKKGDQVVTSGQLKLDNDTPVTINNSVTL